MRTEFIQSLADIPAAQWDAVWDTDYPFVKHAFLLALEQSGCTTATTGWQPHHCLAWDCATLVGALPLYIKEHSYGEYVFDWSWANAYHQTGTPYYPKLVNAIPFTPATGPRWAASDSGVLAKMWDAALADVSRLEISSLHCLFPASPPNHLQFLQRLDCQYHWFNQGYAEFNHFLDTFASRKRKNINKERAKIREQGFSVAMVEGRDLTESNWQNFYRLYRRTYRKRSGHDGYLNGDFFQSIGATMRDSIVMAIAMQDEEKIAAALYFKDSKTLYGRYWGALEEFDGLHFECCFYQGIEYAIQKGLQRFDPGAQGEHKILRGFTPVLTQSFHFLQDERFAAAIARFLHQETQQVLHYCEDARQVLPFKDGQPLTPRDFLIRLNENGL